MAGNPCDVLCCGRVKRSDRLSPPHIARSTHVLPTPAHFEQIRRWIHHVCVKKSADYDQLFPGSTKLPEIGQCVAPKSAKVVLARTRPALARIRSQSVKVDTMFGPRVQNSATVGPETGKVGPTPATFGPISAKCGPLGEAERCFSRNAICFFLCTLKSLDRVLRRFRLPFDNASSPRPVGFRPRAATTGASRASSNVQACTKARS